MVSFASQIYTHTRTHAAGHLENSSTGRHICDQPMDASFQLDGWMDGWMNGLQLSPLDPLFSFTVCDHPKRSETATLHHKQPFAHANLSAAALLALTSFILTPLLPLPFFLRYCSSCSCPFFCVFFVWPFSLLVLECSFFFLVFFLM
ncbi:hypothetical protein BC940DRAFT_300846, partial [Gongronella butleri]